MGSKIKCVFVKKRPSVFTQNLPALFVWPVRYSERIGFELVLLYMYILSIQLVLIHRLEDGDPLAASFLIADFCTDCVTFLAIMHKICKNRRN